MADKKKCFVIMPFSQTKSHDADYWTRHFTSYLKPLIEKNEAFVASRSQPIRGDIATQIITDLGNSDVVVADLTDYNPNVLWELGVRQSFKHCTITIAEKGTQIPFHFSHKGVFYYNADHLENQEFEKQVLDALKDCLEHPNEPDSPVLVALGGRGTFYSIVHAEENSRRMQALRMEVELNAEIVKELYQDCENNKIKRSKKKDKECALTGSLLKSSAVEFLYVNRYLDLEEDFYHILFRYFSIVGSINMKIQDWAKYPKGAEEWFMKSKTVIHQRFAEMEDALKRIN